MANDNLSLGVGRQVSSATSNRRRVSAQSDRTEAQGQSEKLDLLRSIFCGAPLRPALFGARCIARDNGEFSSYLVQDWLEEFTCVGRLHIHLDLRLQTGMGTRARDAYMEFGKQAHGRGGGFALVANRILDLSIAVAAMFVGREVLSSTTSLEEFEAAIGDRVLGFTTIADLHLPEIPINGPAVTPRKRAV